MVPVNTIELLRRYQTGERAFPGLDLDEADLRNVVLADADFSGSWFSGATFDGADLRRVCFRNCNLKCASFGGADVRGARFEGAALEGTIWESARTERAQYAGAHLYGYTLIEGDVFPPA